ncbi:hypothetical protein C440_05293 [Haloferax mucosum ATCC BAA-1512]|uniref:Outer membrane protein n=1 Tax=Haloferax mucosum ATCC BAA-1512 TaxID=662479 RepID=M0IID9_9EURY|nr:SIMPL domain-containing protein [Haloferax mucosum]ELZ96536.1 hypothetical protein C440_05293 [Haloferax mucosum ATCC BAA-1512]
MQRRIIAPLFIVGLVLLAGCLSAPMQTTADGTEAGTNATTISATGTGEVTAEADLAVVNIAVTSTADSADEARGTVADDVAAVRTALTDAGIDEDAIQTTGFSVDPEYDHGEERELVGYRAAHTLSVEVEPDRAGEVIDLAVGAGASEIRGVHFTLTDETRSELRSEALTNAVDSAKADAETVADASDLRITGVQTAAVGGSAPDPYPVAYAEDARTTAGSSTELSPGPVTVRATVQMVYMAE